jgi:hypothetical protein
MAPTTVSSALSTTWNHFRAWDLTAANVRDDLDRWRRWTLILAVVGAVLVTLGQQMGSLTASIGLWAATAGRVINLLGAISIALSAYFAREGLSSEKVQGWTKCRSIAESLKATTYLYRMGVPPFDGIDRDQSLIDRRGATEEAVDGIEPSALSETVAVDLSPFSVPDYILKRVDDQIGFYRRRSAEYLKKTRTLRGIVFWLGAVAVLLGVTSAVKPLVGAWSAVVATVIASLSSYVQGQRYQTLAATYESTARRLETLKDKWGAGPQSDADRNAFIQSCEDTMALENSAWVTQWSQQKPAAQKAPNA